MNKELEISQGTATHDTRGKEARKCQSANDNPRCNITVDGYVPQTPRTMSEPVQPHSVYVSSVFDVLRPVVCSQARRPPQARTDCTTGLHPPFVVHCDRTDTAVGDRTYHHAEIDEGGHEPVRVGHVLTLLLWTNQERSAAAATHITCKRLDSVCTQKVNKQALTTVSKLLSTACRRTFPMTRCCPRCRRKQMPRS